MRNMRISGIVKPFLIPTLIVAGIATSIVGGYTLSIKTKITKWDDKIYPGVKVNNVDLSEKTREEAVGILSAELSKVSEKTIIVKSDSKKFNLKLKEVDAKYNIEDAVELAIKSGKDEGIMEQNSWIAGDNTKEIEAHCNYDEEKMNKFKEKVKTGVNTEPKNATIKRASDGKFNITDGKNGIIVKNEELDESIDDAISKTTLDDVEVNIELNETAPKVTRETLSKIDGVIGSHSTSGLGEANRAHNVQLATEACNGVVVMPGEIFSYNNTLGPRKPERGYKEAGVYINNGTGRDYGGGICQVSSTLYLAAMRANLRSTERHNHMFEVTYAPGGRDATVDWGNLDYKFKNGYETPIYIESYVSGSTITFNIYGNTAEKGNKTYDIVTDAPTTTSDGGTRVKSYHATYENGKEIKRDTIRVDKYQKH